MRLLCCLFVVVLVACKGDPVVWGDPVFVGRPPLPLEFIEAPKIAESTGCPESLRIASNGHSVYGTWWRVESDSSAVLIVARSTNGSDWAQQVIADSTDHSVRGCARPAPAIAADSVTGYVHVAYFLEPAAGSGIFFAHSMDSAATFHAPVPIVFGRNPSHVSVAARGDRVVVAYEDPNAEHPLVGVALSNTMGHLFENRMQATTDNASAIRPTVRLGNDSIFLWWTEGSHDPFGGTTRPAYRAATWH